MSLCNFALSLDHGACSSVIYAITLRTQSFEFSPRLLPNVNQSRYSAIKPNWSIFPGWFPTNRNGFIGGFSEKTTDLRSFSVDITRLFEISVKLDEFRLK